MAPGLRAADANTEREEGSRKGTGERLKKAGALGYLADDDLSGKPLERRGEAVARILHYGLVTPETAYAYRFYLNARGEVADFSWEVP
jgi:hypothetical protein